MALKIDPRLVTVEHDAGVAAIRMVDAATGNALGEPMVEALTAAFESTGADPDIRVIVLLGGADTFSCGAPKELLVALSRGERRPSDVTLPKALLSCSVPIVAALQGHASGGGFALGLAADIVLIANERRYGLPFVNMGFTPGMGTTQLCEHVLSPAVAHELLYTGEMRKGADFAVNSGINYVLPHEQIEATALSLAARIAEKPRATLVLLKRTLSLPRRRAFESSLTLESLMHELTFTAAARTIEEEYVE